MKTFDKPSDTEIAEYCGSRRPGSSSPSPATLPAWRTALLGTVAAGALMLGHDHAALAGPDSCNLLVPAIATCSGNQSNGVAGSNIPGSDFNPEPPPAGDNKTILNVTNLSANITPAVDVPGIGFGSTGNVLINSDTTNGPGGPFEIITTGALGHGVYGASTGVGTDVTIIHTGDITSEADGFRGLALLGSVEITATSNIDAGVNGIIVGAYQDVQVTSVGNIDAGANGIIVGAAQDVQVTSVGNINAANEDGIYAYSAIGTVTVSSTGGITGGNAGIRAVADSGAIEVVSTGDIVVTGPPILGGADSGIRARSNAGSVEVTSTGDITSTVRGIRAESLTASVQVTSIGDISAFTGGINVDAPAGSASVYSSGSITSSVAEGIDVVAGQGAEVTSQGLISAGLDGINALSTAGTVGISSTGDIDAGLSGVAVVAAEAITINSNGDITAGASGLAAVSDNSSVEITSTGNIQAEEFGITVAGPAGVQITSRGNVSSATSIGISAASVNGAVTISSIGNVSALNNAIEAIGVGGVQVTSEGNVSSEAGNGIAMISSGITAAVSSTGNIAADLDGIFAVSNASTATVSSTGNITAGLRGIYANALETANVTSVGNITNADIGIEARSSADVNVNSTGDINVAQYGVLANGAAGVNITTSGGTVDGGNSGILAQSDNAGAVINNLADGIITGNTLAITTATATGATVNNAGTVTGDVSLTGGNNLFDNLDGGLLNSGVSVDLGAGNLLRNAGTLSPAGVGTVSATALTGNLTQTGSGVFEVDVDRVAGTADRVDVTETADLAGSVRVQVQGAAPGEQSNIILSAAGGTTDNGLSVLSSPALQASLAFPNANDVVLTTEVNFAPDAVDLNENQTNLAGNLNEIFDAGGGGLAPVLDALLNGIVSVPDYIAALDQLIPEVYLNTETAALFAAERFNDKLLSCPQAGPGYTAISQGQCMWLRYDGRWMDRDGTFENIGFDEDARGISGGAQVAVAPRWTLGIAGAYENADLETDVGEEADSSRYMLGGVIKYQSGPTLLALVGSVGYGDTEVLRPFDFGGFNATARSSYDVDHMGATFHAAYLMDRGSWYAKPFVDVNVTRIDREAAQETGGGAANLNVSGSDETYFSVTPALELGTTIDRGNGGMVRPYIRAGVTFYSDTDQSLLARFAAAPAGVGAFQTSSEFDDVYADLEAGLTLFRGQSATVSAGYEGRFSDDVESHGIFIKGSRTF